MAKQSALLKPVEEWLFQAEDDYDVAQFLFSGKKYIYTVFMCHLSLEKAMKALYARTIGEPPRTHRLMYFVINLKLSFPEPLDSFIFELSEASIPTRYPETREEMKAIYDAIKVEEILLRTGEALLWIKTKLSE